MRPTSSHSLGLEAGNSRGKQDAPRVIVALAIYGDLKIQLMRRPTVGELRRISELPIQQDSGLPHLRLKRPEPKARRTETR